MAVQAHYPSKVQFLNRNLLESNRASNNFAPSEEACLDQIHSSHIMLFNSTNGIGNGNDNISYNNKIGNCRNQRKRGRNASSNPATAPADSFSDFQPQHQQLNINNNMNNLHQNRIVSTGLKLSSSDHLLQRQQIMTPDPNHSSFFAGHVNSQIIQQRDDIEQLLHLQGEQLRRVLVEKRQQTYGALLAAAEQSVVRRLTEKQAELDKAVRRNAELETRAVQLSMESQAWQAKAHTQESAVASLQSQLHQALANGGRRVGDESGQCQADDAESVYIDPDRVVEVEYQRYSPDCKACRMRPASVVLLPCRHLCVCATCDVSIAACPYCFTMKNSSMEVLIS